MATNKPSSLVLLAAAVVVLLLCAAAPWGANAATCDGRQLSACAASVSANSPPTSACCSILRQEQPCLCRYARDANLQRYVTSPNGWKTLAACKVPAPRC